MNTHHYVPLNHASPYKPMVKDIVHIMHQFQHEHYLGIAHTMEGTHTDCPVLAYSLVCTSVALRALKLKFIRPHKETERLIPVTTTAVYFTMLWHSTEWNSLKPYMLSGNNR